MLDLDKLHKYLYWFSASFIAFEALLLAGSEVSVSLGSLNLLVERKSSKYLTYLFLAPIFLVYFLIFILAFNSFAERFWSILSKSSTLTSLAAEAVNSETGSDYNVAGARPTSLFSREVNTGRWQNKTGILTKPIKFTIPLFKYVWVIISSLIKALVTKGGLFEIGLPTLAFMVPVVFYVYKYGWSII